jgi:uncharacterized protein YndB with AHSA1/START domain
MTTSNYSRTMTIEGATPTEVFAAVTNPRAWWSEDVVGDTRTPGAVFYYHYQDIHRGTFQVTEMEPGKKLFWHVLQNYFNFIKDPTEWTGTDIVFELAGKGSGTELTFTHVGLNPGEECYDVCRDSWGFYLASLEQLITSGAGQPNKGEANANPVVVPPPIGTDLSETITVTATPEAVYAAINDVGNWWSGVIDGASAAVGDSFGYRYQDMHQSRQEVIELVPGKRVAWKVIDSNLSFLEDKSEWTGTTITFDLTPKGDSTELRFTHHGLNQMSECWDACSSGWGGLIRGNLKTLIETGNTSPAPF